MAAANPLYPAAPASSTGYVSDFDLQAAELARRRRYAEMLRQQSMNPQPPPRNAPASWAAPLAQVFSAYNARKIDEDVAKEEQALSQKQSEATTKLFREEMPRPSVPVIGGAGAEQMGGPGGAAGMELPADRATSAGGRKPTEGDWFEFADKLGRTGGRYGQNLGEIIVKKVAAGLVGDEGPDASWVKGVLIEGADGKLHQQWMNPKKPGQTWVDPAVAHQEPHALQQNYDMALEYVRNNPRTRDLPPARQQQIARNTALKFTSASPNAVGATIIDKAELAIDQELSGTPSPAATSATQPTPAAAAAPTPATAAPTPTMVSGPQPAPAPGMVPKLPDYGMPEEDRPETTPLLPDYKVPLNLRGDINVEGLRKAYQNALLQNPADTELVGLRSGKIGGEGQRGGLLPQEPVLAPAPATGGAPIDLARPKIAAPGGAPGYSTESTIGIESGGKHYNIPTIINGQRVSEEKAKAEWAAGRNPPVGVYNSRAEADAAAVARSAEIGRVRGAPKKDVTKMSAAEKWEMYSTDDRNLPFLNQPPTPGVRIVGNTVPQERLNADLKEIHAVRDKHKIPSLEQALRQFDKQMEKFAKSSDVPIWRDENGQWKGATPGMGWGKLNPLPGVNAQLMQQAKAAVDNIQILIRSGQAVTGTELPRVLLEMGSAINQGPEAFWQAVTNLREYLGSMNADVLNAHAPIVRDYWNAREGVIAPSGRRVRQL